MYNVFSSENLCVQLAGKLAMNGSQSSVGKNVLYVSKFLKYSFKCIVSSPFQFRKSIFQCVSSLYTERDYITCDNIRDLIVIRDWNDTKFSQGEIATLIESLCVS